MVCSTRFAQNLYVIAELYFMSSTLTFGDQMVDILFITCQFGFSLIAIVLMVLLSKARYRSGKVLFKAQLHLQEAISVKIKICLMSYLERIYCDDHFTYTIGNVAKFTTRSLSEVCA